ncbi:MBL fold metallo-hydrolase [Cryobacterium sp. SO2]|uniref:MBL fold metallo-hydrolase n=1 Tax=Cryobacterium sp. SO2 TaxID=1897060 RepID=UPI00223E7CFF|nr:MBL fold metallo-hydrolase [Cryobacterium sp. SO2]WEO76879.1 MBL fold metallo-hydrolase [Cryobacterium sp. SO2]
MTESGWLEVGRGVFQRRYDPLDVSVVVAAGPTGLTVIDTRNNPAEGDELIRDVALRFGLPIVAVVNTHAHYDHTFGNQSFAALPSAVVYGHHLIPRHFAEYGAPRLAAQQADPTREPESDLIVPGHGSVVDRDFVQRQAGSLQKVADAIRSCRAHGTAFEDLPPDHELFTLWPPAMLESAFARGFAQLG